ncbi:uncharacterized protein DS421_10g306700 [Arachis hypogaea]|nr:uncharacterized protein DS421_10g306700 [Arachis hypogaea]
MTMSLKYLSSSMDHMNLDSKSDLLKPIIVAAISFLFYPIISTATLSTTLIAFFSFFSEPIFKSGEKRVIGVVVEYDLENMVDVVGVGADTIIKDVEVDASGTARVAVIDHSLILELKRKKEKKTMRVKNKKACSIVASLSVAVDLNHADEDGYVALENRPFHQLAVEMASSLIMIPNCVGDSEPNLVENTMRKDDLDEEAVDIDSAAETQLYFPNSLSSFATNGGHRREHPKPLMELCEVDRHLLDPIRQRQPQLISHILQCNAALSEWHVEHVRLKIPPLNEYAHQRLIHPEPMTVQSRQVIQIRSFQIRYDAVM